MTMTALLTEPESSTEEEPGISHIYCMVCYPDGEKSFCGEDITDCYEDVDYEDDDCVVCLDIAESHVCE